MLTLYAEKQKDGSIKLFRDSEKKKIACHYPRLSKTKPRKNSKTVMFNCARWQINWLPDAK